MQGKDVLWAHTGYYGTSFKRKQQVAPEKKLQPKLKKLKFGAIAKKYGVSIDECFY